jgi:hypothetical protein
MIEDYFRNSAWKFFRKDKTVIAPVIYLADSGIIGGYIDKDMRRWVLRDRRLTFLDGGGVATTIFDRIQEVDDPPAHLSGTSRYDSSVNLVLERIRLPNGVEVNRGSQAGPANFITRLMKPRRQNLVVLPAGPGSAHTHWTQDIDDMDRNWDLCITYYGP